MAGTGAVDIPTRNPCICRGSYTKNYIEEFDGGIFRCGWGHDNCPVLQEYREKRTSNI